MKKLKKDSIVLIDNNEIKIAEFLQKAVLLPAKSILNYYENLGLMFPRTLRMDALRKVITPYVNNERPHVTPLTDELLYRIRWFDTFSESQLVNLLPVFEDNILLDEYKEELWLSFIAYMLEKQVSPENFDKLFRLIRSLENVPPLEVLDGKKYNDILNPLFYDEKNVIDGLTLEIFRPVVYKCSTLGEVRDIGKKYGVNVPRRLKKQELVEIIIDEVKDRGELTPELEENLNSMTVIPLQRFAKNNDIKVSIELKKNEIIEYILKNAQQTKATYFKPQAGSYEIYDQEDFEMKDLKDAPVALEEELKVTVKFISDESETSLLLTFGEKLQKPENPIKHEHDFVGWYLNEELFDFNQEITEDLSLVAKFEPTPKQMVKVIFNLDGKTTEVETEKGSVVLEPETVEKEGYKFLGWHLNNVLFDFEKPIEEDLMLDGYFEELKADVFLVTFVAKGERTTAEVQKNTPVEEPKPPFKEGYEFIGWFLEDNLYDFEDLVTSDIELVAQWYELEPETVVVSFINEEDAKEFEIIKGEKISKIEEPTKEGYKFIGWFLSEELYDFSLDVVEDLTLIAKWEENVTVQEPTEATYISTENIDLTEVIKEMKKIGKKVEELKEAVFLSSNPKVDQLAQEIDFSDKNGFEDTFEQSEAIKETVILMPYQLKVSKASFKELIKRKNSKDRKEEKNKKQVKPIPVVVIDEEEDNSL